MVGMCKMASFRNALLVGVVTVLQSAPAFAQCNDPAGCAAVPGPEIGAGVAGLILAGGIVYFLRGRARR